MSQGNNEHLFQPNHPRRLIPELCRHFYDQGWFSGTGGGISIKQGNNIYVAPSAVQKERLEPNDLFILKPDGSVSQSPPAEKNLTLSQCTPLFMNAYKGKLTSLKGNNIT
jgi:methylthioribulose-1-phosphate dehydratase